MEHEHHVHNLEPAAYNSKAFIWGIALNIAFVIAEVVAGLVYNSIALLTDAGHNLGDVASLILSLLAFRLAAKKSNARYTYGYKKTTVLAALLNAVILLTAIAVLGYESVRRLMHPEPATGGVIAWVAAIGIVINAVTAFLFFKKGKQELNARSAYMHMLADALVSVGVVVAGLVIRYTGWYWVDPLAGIIVMTVILFGTWHLLVSSLQMTIDAVPQGIDLNDIKNIIASVHNVTAVGHVHVWPLSTMENALTAHVVIEAALSFEEKLEVIEEIRHQLEHHNIQHSTIEMQSAIAK